MHSFVRACVVKPVPDDDLDTAICWNAVVPAAVRAHLAAREIDCDDVLAALQVPLLVTQGRADSVVLPAMAEHVLATCPTAQASLYEGTGHVLHLEDPGRFNRELAELTRRARGQTNRPRNASGAIPAHRSSASAPVTSKCRRASLTTPNTAAMERLPLRPIGANIG